MQTNPQKFWPNCDEVWLPCPDYETFYEVSSFGNLRRIKGGKGTDMKKNDKHRIRKLPVSKSGCVTVVLYGDKIKTYNFHTLICRAFHGEKPSALHVVAHYDGNPTNNRIENLRWALPKENSADSIRHGTWPAGSRNGKHILNESQVLEIRKYHSDAKKLGLEINRVHSQLAELYKVVPGNIKAIVYRQNWRHI